MTEAEWLKLYHVRCQSKRGVRLTPEEMKLCGRAARADPKRYKAMDLSIWNETRPIGARERKE